jgi:hypothetical protein
MVVLDRDGFGASAKQQKPRHSEATAGFCCLSLDRSSAAAERFGRVEIWRGDAEAFRFQIPLIKPDMRLSRIRLSDKG